MLALMYYTLDGAPSATAYATTMVFTGFVLVEFEKLYVVRWLRETPLPSNRWLGVAVATSLTLHLGVLYTPLGDYFGTVPLGVSDWVVLGVVMLAALPLFLGVAVVLKRRFGNRASTG